MDFSKNCEERNGMVLPLSGRSIDYYRCGTCGFLFSAAFDAWPLARFAEEIYNDAYILVDPEYASIRPANMARVLLATFGIATLRELALLDYGGGNGELARVLGEAGVASARSYDPVSAPDADALASRYDIITCFEALEHDPQPIATLETIAACANESSLVIFSTLVQGAQSEREGLRWWYVAPRNGHISIFSRAALATAWGRVGFRVASMNDDLHVAFRTIPAFARGLFAGLNA